MVAAESGGAEPRRTPDRLPPREVSAPLAVVLGSRGSLTNTEFHRQTRVLFFDTREYILRAITGSGRSHAHASGETRVSP